MPLWNDFLVHMEKSQPLYFSGLFLGILMKSSKYLIFGQNSLLLSKKTSTYRTRSLAANLHLKRNWVRLSIDRLVRIDDGFTTTGGFVCNHNGGGFLVLLDIWAYA